eukprot:jgi/Bigna1/136235/aug1.33_g10943
MNDDTSSHGGDPLMTTPSSTRNNVVFLDGGLEIEEIEDLGQERIISPQKLVSRVPPKEKENHSGEKRMMSTLLDSEGDNLKVYKTRKEEETTGEENGTKKNTEKTKTATTPPIPDANVDDDMNTSDILSSSTTRGGDGGGGGGGKGSLESSGNRSTLSNRYPSSGSCSSTTFALPSSLSTQEEEEEAKELMSSYLALMDTLERYQLNHIIEHVFKNAAQKEAELSLRKSLDHFGLKAVVYSSTNTREGHPKRRPQNGNEDTRGREQDDNKDGKKEGEEEEEGESFDPNKFQMEYTFNTTFDSGLIISDDSDDDEGNNDSSSSASQDFGNSSSSSGSDDGEEEEEEEEEEEDLEEEYTSSSRQGRRYGFNGRTDRANNKTTEGDRRRNRRKKMKKKKVEASSLQNTKKRQDPIILWKERRAAIGNLLKKEFNRFESVKIGAILNQVEKELYLKHHVSKNDGDDSKQYVSQARQLIGNLRANPKLRLRVLSGKVKPNQLVNMSTSEMASEEIQKERKRLTAERFISDKTDSQELYKKLIRRMESNGISSQLLDVLCQQIMNDNKAALAAKELSRQKIRVLMEEKLQMGKGALVEHRKVINNSIVKHLKRMQKEEKERKKKKKAMMTMMMKKKQETTTTTTVTTKKTNAAAVPAASPNKEEKEKEEEEGEEKGHPFIHSSGSRNTKMAKEEKKKKAIQK